MAKPSLSPDREFTIAEKQRLRSAYPYWDTGDVNAGSKSLRRRIRTDWERIDEVLAHALAQLMTETFADTAGVMGKAWINDKAASWICKLEALLGPNRLHIAALRLMPGR